MDLPTPIPTALADGLRDALVNVLSGGTWSEIEEDFVRVQLAWREDLDPGWGKPKYVRKVLNRMGPDDVISLAERCMETFADRHVLSVQDALWWIEAEGQQSISDVTRLALADSFEGLRLHPQRTADVFLRAITETDSLEIPTTTYGSDRTLLRKPGPLDMLFGVGGEAANAERISHRDLLASVGYFRWSDNRVLAFLQALVRPEVRSGEEQRSWVAMINEVLLPDCFELSATERVSGHDVYSARPIRAGVDGRPKNLIFASVGPKPELGFSDAINNDIVILSQEDSCLVYSERLTEQGLLWEELVAWWGEGEGLPAEKARDNLGRRLTRSLASKPERLLFAWYFREYRGRLGPRLPALIPQVYLHYDPKTVRELRSRGEGKRFSAQRMDFLMLLPRNVRVVIEVDGQQHYATGLGKEAKPSPCIYAETTRSDRALRLAGYEVYRFAGWELSTRERAASSVRGFFDRLFRRHGVG